LISRAAAPPTPRAYQSASGRWYYPSSVQGFRRPDIRSVSRMARWRAAIQRPAGIQPRCRVSRLFTSMGYRRTGTGMHSGWRTHRFERLRALAGPTGPPIPARCTRAWSRRTVRSKRVRHAFKTGMRSKLLRRHSETEFLKPAIEPMPGRHTGVIAEQSCRFNASERLTTENTEHHEGARRFWPAGTSRNDQPHHCSGSSRIGSPIRVIYDPAPGILLRAPP
jgi:hypothetical protein